MAWFDLWSVVCRLNGSARPSLGPNRHVALNPPSPPIGRAPLLTYAPRRCERAHSGPQLQFCIIRAVSTSATWALFEYHANTIRYPRFYLSERRGGLKCKHANHDQRGPPAIIDIRPAQSQSPHDMDTTPMPLLVSKKHRQAPRGPI